MGSPSVFHPAPPQPASKARMTCSPVLAGGAEASQNGMGLSMPAVLVRRSAMGEFAPLSMKGTCGVAPVVQGVDHLLAAVHAVAAGEDLGMAGGAGEGIGHHAAP